MAGMNSKGIDSIGLFFRQRLSFPLNSARSKPVQSNLQISFPSRLSSALFVNLCRRETGRVSNLLCAKLYSFVLKENMNHLFYGVVAFYCLISCFLERLKKISRITKVNCFVHRAHKSLFFISC